MANYGVLSAFEGLGKATSEVGKIGLIDTLEQRRSKTESDLEAKLKGEDRTFEMEKMKKKHGYDVALEKEKAKGKVAKGAKDSDKYELKAGDGTPLKYDDVRKAWSNQVGADLESFDPNAAQTFEDYLGDRNISYRLAPPPKAPSPLAESVYRERYKQHRPDASEDEVNAAVERQRTNKMIVDDPSGTSGMVLAEPGVMDAHAAEVDPMAGNGQFGGGQPQGDLKAKIEGYRDKNAKKDIRTAGFEQTKKDIARVNKAAKKVDAAIKKGNIKQVSKVNIAIALNDAALVGRLTDYQMQQIIQFMSE